MLMMMAPLTTPRHQLQLWGDCFHYINTSELRQEEIYAYGSGVENSVEGSGPYYGKDTDNFIYRTFLQAQQSKPLNNLVTYTPIPREGKKPIDNSAENQWSIQLKGVTGKAISSINSGKHDISFIIQPKKRRLCWNCQAIQRITAIRLTQLTAFPAPFILTAPMTESLTT
ncbi:MAG: hypothetical protein RR394_03460 [Oscillospiraceae bacterium]